GVSGFWRVGGMAPSPRRRTPARTPRTRARGISPRDVLHHAASSPFHLQSFVGPSYGQRDRHTSVPLPKFASLCRSLVCELRNRKTLATYYSTLPIFQYSPSPTRCNYN